MSNEPLIDPTAGEQARQIRLHPELAQPILDPTDPRCEQAAPGGATESERETAAQRPQLHRL